MTTTNTSTNVLIIRTGNFASITNRVKLIVVVVICYNYLL